MEPAVPPWLNETFLSTALQGEEGHSNAQTTVSVVSFTAKYAVTVGNNYTSNVLRVVVEYKVGTSTDLRTASLIVKAPIETGIMQELDAIRFYEKEPNFYKNLLSSLSSKAKQNFGPEIYYCQRPNGLIFNDLNAEGYVMCDRQKQLDYSHCKHALETLARFHAASVASHREDPSLVESIGEEPMYKEEGPMAEQFKPLMQLCLQMFVEVLKGMGEKPDLIELITIKSKTIWGSLLDIFKPREKGLNVLNHGDCWTSNLLFKHNDSGEVIDVKLIDFQALRYMSPSIDLIYFLWSSANEEVRENHAVSLYECYRKTLNQTLEDLNCDERLSHEELEEHLKSASALVLTMITGTAPMFLNEPENAMNTAEIDKESFSPALMLEWYQKVYSGKTYQSLLPGYIRQLKDWFSTYGLE